MNIDTHICTGFSLLAVSTGLGMESRLFCKLWPLLVIGSMTGANI